MTKHFSRLKLKWDVHGDSKAYAPETELIFNIQVNQTEENRTVLNVSIFFNESLNTFLDMPSTILN